MKIAVLASGHGSNLEALMAAEKNDELGGGKIVLVVSDNPDAYALKRAREKDIDIFIQEKKGFATREEYDKHLVGKLREYKVELIVLAGFMRILSGYFIEEFRNNILNIHPALLPAFKGAHGIKDAFEHGVKVTGVTVHFVTDKLDDGPIILQECVKVGENDTLETLEKKIHRVEHRLYPAAVSLFAQKRLVIDGRKVKIAAIR